MTTTPTIAPDGPASRHEHPSRWVVRFASLVAPGGSVLDVACGSGRHARWFEAAGHRVTGIDRDADALARSDATETIRHDLEASVDPRDGWPLAGRRFDAVVVANYLHRPLFPLLLDALAPGGILLYETFAAGNERYGKPSNPAFLLAPGELLERCASLEIVAYEDGLVDVPRAASIQRICAVDRSGDAAPGSGDRVRPASRHALSPRH